MQDIVSRIKSELQFFDSTTVKVENTTRGVRFHARPQRGSPPTKQLSHPFKIYQPTNFSSFATGITFLDPASGIGTVCNIDSTKPTDFNAIPPTVNPATDAWRFWAVRCGQVEIRFNFSIPVPYGQYPAGEGGDFIAVFNNWGGKYNLIEGNVDAICPEFGFDYDDPTTESIGRPIIISSTPDEFGFVNFGLWIQITQDANQEDRPLMVVSGANFGTDFYDYFSYSGPNFIPLGIIFGETVTTNPVFSIVQCVYDHVSNRYPPGNGHSGGGGVQQFSGVMNWRGFVYSDGTSDPPDLINQVVYPGDVVSMSTASDQPTTGMAMFNGSGGSPVIIANDGPFDDDVGNWQVILTITF